MTTASTLGSVGRAATWRLLSLGFASPADDRIAEVEAIAAGILEIDPSPETAELLAALEGSSVDELASQYHALFGGAVCVSPYEGSYELDPVRQGRQMADVAAFYRAFGAEPGGPAGERPDYVGCELEFLAFLELRLLVAVEENEDAELLYGIGDTFLRDHAGRWLPTFFSAVEEAAVGSSLYRTLARVGAQVVQDELDRRGIECAPPPRSRQRLPVEGDSFACA